MLSVYIYNTNPKLFVNFYLLNDKICSVFFLCVSMTTSVIVIDKVDKQINYNIFLYLKIICKKDMRLTKLFFNEFNKRSSIFFDKLHIK